MKKLCAQEMDNIAMKCAHYNSVDETSISPLEGIVLDQNTKHHHRQELIKIISVEP
jgi:uncharacterized protein (UPF0147 family)